MDLKRKMKNFNFTILEIGRLKLEIKDIFNSQDIEIWNGMGNFLCNNRDFSMNRLDGGESANP